MSVVVLIPHIIPNRHSAKNNFKVFSSVKITHVALLLVRLVCIIARCVVVCCGVLWCVVLPERQYSIQSHCNQFCLKAQTEGEASILFFKKVWLTI